MANSVLGIPLGKLVCLVLAIVALILALTNDSSKGLIDSVVFIVTLVYLIVFCVLALIGKLDILNASATVAMDVALGVILCTQFRNLDTAGNIIGLILGILLICFAFFGI